MAWDQPSSPSFLTCSCQESLYNVLGMQQPEMGEGLVGTARALFLFPSRNRRPFTVLAPCVMLLQSIKPGGAAIQGPSAVMQVGHV